MFNSFSIKVFSLVGIGAPHSNRFFNYSISEGFILRNPCDNIKIPKDFSTTSSEVEIFSKEDLKAIINYTDNYAKLIKYIALTSLATGMRQGEVLGLKWDDINFDNKEISIQRTLTCYTTINGKERKLVRDIHLPKTKTKNSIRTRPLPDSLIPIFKEIKKQQNADILKAGSSYKSEYKCFIFLTKDGNLIHKSWVDTSWRNYLKNVMLSIKNFMHFDILMLRYNLKVMFNLKQYPSYQVIQT